jgi:hypothetical protein
VGLVIFLPRIARALHHPALAVMLGLLLLGIGSYGLVSGDIPTLWAGLIVAVGALNVLRFLRQPPDNARRAATS